MAQMHKINPVDIKLNMYFSAPVFFDDGKNMFLAKGKMTKQYHIASLKRWNIPYLLTSGHELEANEVYEFERMAGFNTMDDEDVEEVVELEEFL